MVNLEYQRKIRKQNLTKHRMTARGKTERRMTELTELNERPNAEKLNVEMTAQNDCMWSVIER